MTTPATSVRKRTRRRDGRTRSARSERRDSRGDLVAAALDVFAERGYADASVDDVAERAGYSKGALYWHFDTKDDLFFADLDEYVDRPWRETIDLLESATAERDMSVEASRRFGELLRGQAKLLMVEHDYRARALRVPELRARYAKRQRDVRAALAKALAARVDALGAPPLEDGGEAMATAFIALALGLAHERLIDPDAVPEDALGSSFALMYAGHVARARGE